MGQFPAQAFFHLALEPAQHVHRAKVIHHQPIAYHLGILVLTRQRHAVFIKHRDDRISRAQVHAHVQRALRHFSERRIASVRIKVKHRGCT